MIIKNGEVRLLVQDTDVAIDRVTQVVGDLGGYIVSSRIWFQAANGENYKYSTITIGIPVEQFENALRRLRSLAIRVLDENASGEDVTDQYVDLQSQLTNLEATRARIRTFLDEAKTVEEALKVNEELSKIEAQIEEITGKINYLKDRSAFSTNTINIEPDVPTPTPAPTATPLTTSTPTPWAINETFKSAGTSLVESYQGLAEFFVWLIVAVLPVLIPFMLIGWVLWRLFRPKKKAKIDKPLPPVPPPSAPPAE